MKNGVYGDALDLLKKIWDEDVLWCEMGIIETTKWDKRIHQVLKDAQIKHDCGKCK